VLTRLTPLTKKTQVFARKRVRHVTLDATVTVTSQMPTGAFKFLTATLGWGGVCSEWLFYFGKIIAVWLKKFIHAAGSQFHQKFLNCSGIARRGAPPSLFENARHPAAWKRLFANEGAPRSMKSRRFSAKIFA
jgi:hypothetical protein